MADGLTIAFVASSVLGVIGGIAYDLYRGITRTLILERDYPVRKDRAAQGCFRILIGFGCGFGFLVVLVLVNLTLWFLPLILLASPLVAAGVYNATVGGHVLTWIPFKGGFTKRWPGDPLPHKGHPGYVEKPEVREPT